MVPLTYALNPLNNCAKRVYRHQFRGNIIRLLKCLFQKLIECNSLPEKQSFFKLMRHFQSVLNSIYVQLICTLRNGHANYTQGLIPLQFPLIRSLNRISIYVGSLVRLTISRTLLSGRQEIVTSKAIFFYRDLDRNVPPTNMYGTDNQNKSWILILS